MDEKFFEILKKLFPKPIMPQKRYILAIFLSIWVVFKVWAIYYEKPKIEQLVEDARMLGLFLLSDTSQYSDDKNEQNSYGEVA